MSTPTPARQPVDAEPVVTESVSSRVEPQRIIGLDIARFFALIGMMVAHVWIWNIGLDGSWEANPLHSVVAGKAAALFATLAGVGIALTTEKMRQKRLAAARWNLFGRGLVLIVIGLTLSLAPSGIAVILAYYGLTFWLVIPLLNRSRRTLAIIAVALAVMWPFASSLVRGAMGNPLPSIISWVDIGVDPEGILPNFFVTGFYPVTTWIVYVLIGLIVGRPLLIVREKRALRRYAIRLSVVGAGVSALGFGASALLLNVLGGLSALTGHDQSGDALTAIYDEAQASLHTESFWWLASPAPHTGTFFDLAITGGIAVAVIALAVLLGSYLTPLLRRLLSPLTSAGSAPLTVYTLHVIAASAAGLLWLVDPDAALGFFWLVGADWFMSSWQLWLIHVALALVVGAALRLAHRRGPLETLVTWVGRRCARLVER